MSGSRKMMDKMTSNQTPHKTFIPHTPKALKRERCFDLSLQALVSGTNAEGSDFEEIAELSSISSQEAVLTLENKVLIGSKLSISLKIPKTLLLQNRLNLTISGEVIYVSSDRNNPRIQRVGISLNRLFKIHPINSLK